MAQNTTGERWAYSITEVGALTSLSRATLYRLEKAGKLRVVKVGGRMLVPADSLRKLLEGDERTAFDVL